MAVVTPVHNGAASLAACLASMRVRRYRNWIHIVVGNASTDATCAIARAFAETDRRVIARAFRELVPMLDHFDRAFAAVSAGARYCKAAPRRRHARSGVPPRDGGRRGAGAHTARRAETRARRLAPAVELLERKQRLGLN